MARRSGQILLGLGLVAAVLLGGAVFLSQTGQIQNLLGFIFQNFGNIFWFVAGIGVIAIVVKNATQDNPQWRRDFTFFVVFVVALFALQFAISFIQQQTGSVSADMTVTVTNKVLQDPVVSGASVTGYDSSGPLTQAFTTVSQQQTTSATGLFGIGICDVVACPGDQVNGQVTVTCGRDNTEVGASPYSFQVFVNEDGVASTTFRMSGLPKGGRCDAVVDIGTDTHVEPFGVPSNP